MKRLLLIICLMQAIASTALFAFPLKNDFDGDHITDLVVWRPSTGTWYVKTSTGAMPSPANGTWLSTPGGWYKQWGLPSDIPLTGDFDADGKSDVVVIRPASSDWYFAFSNGASFPVQLGLNADLYCATDANWPSGGVDFKDDMIAYRPSNRTLYIRNSMNNQLGAFPLGAPSGGTFISAEPLGHFRKIGIFSEGVGWALRYYSSTGAKRLQLQAVFPGSPYGNVWDFPDPNNAIPIFGDYNGDGQSGFVTYDNGLWTIIDAGQISVIFGSASESPVIGDFDGDGKFDLATWNSQTGLWRVFSSGATSGYVPPHMTLYSGFEYRASWGLPGDKLPK